MKNVTKNPTSILRCINKETKDYVEIPCSGGHTYKIRQALFDIAYSYTEWNSFSEPKNPEFHFFALYHPERKYEAFCSIRIPIANDEFEKLKDSLKINKTNNLYRFLKREEDHIFYAQIKVNLEMNELEPDSGFKKSLETLGIKNINNWITPKNLW